MGRTGQRLPKSSTGYENRLMVPAAPHYESELLLETPKSSGSFSGNSWQQLTTHQIL